MNASSQRPPFIYIVAAKQDAKWRDRIRVELEIQSGSKVTVWSRGSLPTGSQWRKEMEQAREQAAGAVVVLSTHSVSSEYVREEVEHLQQLGALLFPIVAEPCEWGEFPGVARITIFDEARPLNSHPAEIQNTKVAEFARAVLARVHDEQTSLSQESQQSQRDHASKEREGEKTSEQQEEEDDARLREWGVKLSPRNMVVDFLQAQEGGLGRDQMAEIIEVLANDQRQIRNRFGADTELPREARRMIARLSRAEAEFRQGLETLPAEPTAVTPESTSGEGDETARQKDPTANSTGTSPPAIDLFSSSSRRALDWADTLRKGLAQRHVHTEHLIAALYHSDDERVLDAFNKAGIDWPKLLSVLHQSDSKIPINPDEIRVESGKATALPDLSGGVKAALELGVALARSENSYAVLPHHLLFGVLSVDAPAAEALQGRGLRRELLKQKTGPPPPRIGSPRGRVNAGRDIPGVSSDVAKGVDLLDIEAEVAALCSVIAARDVQPPLSIGLFGDWGTGKSFFMEKMWERIVSLEKEGAAENSPFSSHIVQLKFNAWYYIDTNLWATLGSEIFRGLADALAADNTQPAQARERLLAAAASQRDVVAEAERRTNAASEQLHQNEERLTRLASDEADIDSRLSRPSSILRAAYRVAVQDPQVQAKVAEAAKTLNISNVKAAATETKAQLMELHGLLGLARATWLAGRRHKKITVLSILAAVMIVAISYALTKASGWAKEISLDTAFGRVAAFITAIAAALGPLASKARTALTFIRKAREQSLTVVDEERRKKEQELRARKQKIQEETVSLQKRVDEATVVLAKLEQQLEELRADRQMSNFIKSRNESRDYTSHLGVIARARDDFQRLSNLLEEVRKQTEEERKGKLLEEKLLLPRIDRIILYIDDLDRCPEDKVVDVLQAVHLLLAFPLFVVVVGVDSRWLLHSLKQHSRAFHSERNGDAGELDEERLHWQSTPLNYLEKIFQIPFSLRPMQPGGFADLVEKLTEPRKFSQEETDPEQAESVAGLKSSSVVHGQEAEPQVDVTPTPVPAALVSVAPLAPQNGGRTATDKKRTPFKPLNLSNDEREFMKRLHPLISTPRAAKRFVNVYRLLRALSDEDEAFRGTKERAEHRAVLVLLAILTGHPSQGTELLRDLLDGQATDTSWWEFMETYRSRGKPKSSLGASQAEAERWRHFFEKIDEVRNDVRETGSCRDFDESCDGFVKWAGQVSRFSFQSARVVLQRTSEDPPTNEPVTPA